MMRFTSLLITQFFVLLSYGQMTHLQADVESGGLANEIGKAIVFRTSDSTMVKGSYIDSNRIDLFFKAKDKENYYLKITAPGFTDSLIPFDVTDSLVVLPKIVLAKNQTLDEVQATYTRPTFERTMNGIKINVEGTTLQELNTLFDVLKASPRLNSPDEESIEIIGRGVPLILIDRQPLVSNEELKAIPANEVERIEILTNPSAKYRAQGSANGVIEVYTKNFSLQGYRAHIRADGGMNVMKYPQSGLNAGLNIKKGKFSLDGFGGMNYNESLSTYTSELYGPEGLHNSSNSLGENTNIWQNYKVKMGYEINDKQRLSLGNRGYGSLGSNDNNSLTEYRQNEFLRGDKRTENSSSYKWLNNATFANYTWETDTIGSVFEVNLNYSRRNSGGNNENRSEINDFVNNNSTDYHVKTTSADQPNIGELRVVWERYLDTNELKLELGGEFSMLFNQKKFNRFNRVSDRWEEDMLFSNSYTYQEQIGGMFAQISKKWKKFGGQIGIRGEYTRLDGYSKSLQQQFMDSSFILPFPNAGVLFEFSENVSLTAYYESGIDRPQFTNYDPFIRREDSLSVSYGNPYLRPSYEHTIGMELDLFYQYNLSVSYSRANNPVSTLNFIDPQTLVSSSTPWNAAFEESYSANVSVPLRTKWLDGWNSLWVDYNMYEFTEVFNRDPFSNVTFGFSSYLTFKLKHDFKITNSLYLARWGSDDFTGSINRFWSIRAMKDFKKPDINVFAEVNQLAPNSNIGNSVSGNFRSTSEYRNRFTGFRVGVFYKFGRLKANTNIKESESGQSDRF